MTLLIRLVFLGGVLASFPSSANITFSHERPYFMPEYEQSRIADLIQREPWARFEIQHLKELHRSGAGYASAFLYALERDDKYLPAAREWLLSYGRNGGDLGGRALEARPDFFRDGQPWLGDVYYKIDIRPLVAYDWVYTGLTPEDRQIIEKGILASARFRMRDIPVLTLSF